jgi:hypothetical protein
VLLLDAGRAGVPGFDACVELVLEVEVLAGQDVAFDAGLGGQ